MKKIMRTLFIVMLTFFMFIESNCYAAWWGTPGYEWALSKRLTSIKTQSQLGKEVTLSDYYNIILKYLELKGVEPKGKVVQGLYVEELYNGSIEGLVKDINGYIGPNVKKLTPQQYRIVDELIAHSTKIMDDQAIYLNRDDIKDLTLYLDLARYRAATLLSEDSKIEKQYKANVLYSLRNTKYAVSIKYGIMPMCGEVTRESFLVLMHNLLSDTNMSSTQIIDSLNESGVLLGYDNSLWLNQNLKYSEMLTFLYRFEAYDFNPSNEE